MLLLKLEAADLDGGEMTFFLSFLFWYPTNTACSEMCTAALWQTVTSVSRSGRLHFFPKISAWRTRRNCKGKFYLEVSASPSGCMFPVIVLSISSAVSFLFLLPPVQFWQWVGVGERWDIGRGKEGSGASPGFCIVFHLSSWSVAFRCLSHNYP